MSVLVATTVAPYKAEDGGDVRWLRFAERWRSAGHRFFCAAQMVGDTDKLSHLIERLDDIDAAVWWFGIHDGAETITTQGRLVGITTGRNLAHEYAANRMADPPEAILFLDTDVDPGQPDLIDRLLEVPRPLVGGNLACYCLGGPQVQTLKDADGRYIPFHLTSCQYPDYVYGRCRCGGLDIREHWCSAGCLLVRKGAYELLRWRWSLPHGQTDDVCFQEDAERMGFGMTYVRHDLAVHHEGVDVLERRGHDLRTQATVPEPFEHGSYGMYLKGCRCTLCQFSKNPQGHYFSRTEPH